MNYESLEILYVEICKWFILLLVYGFIASFILLLYLIYDMESILFAWEYLNSINFVLRNVER